MIIYTGQVLEDFLYYYKEPNTTENLGRYMFIPRIFDEQVFDMLENSIFPEWYYKNELLRNAVNEFIKKNKSKV